jgi:hypothetical protein
MRSSSRWTERARKFVLALALALLAAPGSAAPPLPRKLPPVEQCGGDPAFDAFRQKLTRAVLTQDRNGLMRLIAPHAIADFGGGEGPAAVGKAIDDAGDEYWSELKRIIKLGCARSGSARVIPSLTVQFDPWAEVKDADNLAVALRGAKLRRSPEPRSRPVAALDWTVVRTLPGAGDLWTQVVLPGGRRGWLMDDELVSPTGYRFWMEKRGGHWIVTALVAGD